MSQNAVTENVAPISDDDRELALEMLMERRSMQGDASNPLEEVVYSLGWDNDFDYFDNES